MIPGTQQWVVDDLENRRGQDTCVLVKVSAGLGFCLNLDKRKGYDITTNFIRSIEGTYFGNFIILILAEWVQFSQNATCTIH